MTKEQLREARRINQANLNRLKVRKWAVMVDGVTDAVPMGIDVVVEEAHQLRVLERAKRRELDPFGTGIWEIESLEQLVRRQNES
jgi:hypothetical protein